MHIGLYIQENKLINYNSIEAYFVHPDYKESDPNTGANVCLMRLRQRAKYAKNIQRAALPYKDEKIHDGNISNNNFNNMQLIFTFRIGIKIRVATWGSATFDGYMIPANIR